jgi:hypothetical protein
MAQGRKAHFSVVFAALFGCGGTASQSVRSEPLSPAPALVPSATSHATADPEQQERARTRAHAHKLGEAAAVWRAAHGGTCPTLKDVLASGTFEDGIDRDREGQPMAVRCFEHEVWIVSSGETVLSAERYSGPVVQEHPIAPTVENVDFEAIVRSRVQPGAKRCYQRALASDPSATGEVKIDIKSAGDMCRFGQVTVTGSVPADVRTCIKGVIEAVNMCEGHNGGMAQPISFSLKL